MDLDQVMSILGIEPEDQVLVYESVEFLWRDMEKSTELTTLLQDDVFASRLNAHLQCHIVRRIGALEFVDASYGPIGEMIAGLRGKGESYVLFHNGGFPGVGHRRPTDDLDAALRAIGWRALSNDEMRVLPLVPNLARC